MQYRGKATTMRQGEPPKIVGDVSVIADGFDTPEGEIWIVIPEKMSPSWAGAERYWLILDGDPDDYPYSSTEALISEDVARALAALPFATVREVTSVVGARMVEVHIPRLDHPETP